MKKAHSVSILNQRLVVRSEATEAHVEQVAQLVNSKIQEVMEGMKTASTLNAALLTCLNLADELLNLREGEGQAKAKVAKKIRDLIRRIDVQLESESPSAAAG